MLATAAAGTQPTLDAAIQSNVAKMERRDSSTSESSLEHLDLGRTPKKLSSQTSATSTPHTTANGSSSSNANDNNKSNQNNTKKSASNDAIITTDAFGATATPTQTERLVAGATTKILPHQHRLHDSDEANDYDDDDEESPDEQRSKQNALSARSQRHHKRRSTATRLDKRTSVHLEFNADDPNSLRKKFRFNRSTSASEQLTNNNESGFVDASCSSHYLNASAISMLSAAAASASMAGAVAAATTSMSTSASASAVGINLTSSHNSMSTLASVSASANGSNSSSSAASSPRGCGAGLAASSTSVSSPESGIGDREREDMKFVCTICDVVSATRHEFTNHIRCHNYASGDTENYTCAICSKVLSSASSLDRHVLVHTGERPFNCKYCHLTFTTNGNMHRHMRTHKQHQHNHHHRRNSNGTKHVTTSSNNNNNTVSGNVTSATVSSGETTTLATNTTNTYTQLSHGLINEGVKSSAASGEANEAMATDAGMVDAATAVVVPAGVGGGGGGGGPGGAGASVNGKRLHSSGVESCESDGGCSTDSSSSAISHSSTNNHNKNNNNNNNNSENINNNVTSNYNNNNSAKRNSLGNFKRKCSDHHNVVVGNADADGDADGGDITKMVAMKRRVKTTINNNVIGEDVDEFAARIANNNDGPAVTTTNTSCSGSASSDDDDAEQKPLFTCPVCPVCNAGDFGDMRALDNHLDSEHSDIPAKCRHCEVVFRTHRQLSSHPCTQRLLINRHMPLVDCAKCRRSFANGHDLELHARECHTAEVRYTRRSRSLSDSYTAPPLTEADVEEKTSLARSNFFRQLYLQSQKPFCAQSLISLPSPQHSANDEADVLNVSNSDIKQEADVEPSDQLASNLLSQQSHDSKDLADIQSILNMTSSSSTSNFLKNFEQSVNTPSSNYSLDKDEEEAQDAFTSEFRKMKLRGEFPCKLCTAVFPNLRALKGHNRVHLGAVGPAGPFRCNMCPYSICDKAALVRHMRTHNGDRPYECAECNYAFTTKANCERHLRNRHAKTTRDEVKRAIIYHPSEDSTCDDPVKKLHMFSSPDFDDDMELPYQQHHPKDRSTPVSHLKEMLTTESPSAKPMKIQVKSLEQLLDKSTGSIGSYNDAYEERPAQPSMQPVEAAPIDLSMDVLDLSKKPSVKPIEKEVAPPPVPLMVAENGIDAEKKLDLFSYVKENLNMPKMLELWSLSAQFPFMPDFRPLMNQMFAGTAAGNPFIQPAVDMNKANMPAPPNMTPPMLPHLNSMMADKLNTHPHSTSDVNVMNQMLPKSLMVPSTHNANMNMSRHSHIPSTVLPGGPVKMVIKNGVLMPKQKQRRYRTERPFACEHCSARFTLRSNMERHVKQQHPQYYAQRHRSGHQSMRGRGASSATAMNSITNLQAAFAQAHNQASQAQGNGMGASPISEQVKYAILAQQLKARKDTDLLQQALAHGSSSIVNNHQMLLNAGAALGPLGPPNGLQFAFNQLGQPTNINGSIEDDEPKLVIDEDEDDDDVEEILDDNEDDEEELQFANENFESMRNIQTTASVVEEVRDKPPNSESTNETAKKVAETILEQAIKTGQKLNSTTRKPDTSFATKPAPSKLAAPVTPAAPTAPVTPANTMKAMIAQAESVGKFLKEVASSPFKDESQDLVPVAKLVDNATNNAVSFNNYFRPSDVANHMEQSDEEGLVASGSASESNNSGTEDVAAPAEPKKKSAYSLAPNRVSCPYCQRMFPWSSSLRRHILTHTGQKPFKCSHCPLLFTTKSNCDRHLLRKHGDVESAVSVYVPTEDVNEPIPVPKSVEEIEQQQRKRDEEDRKRRSEEAQLERERREKEQRLQQEQEHQNKLFKQMAVAQLQQQLNVSMSTANASSSADADLRAKEHLSQLNADLPYKCHLCESSFAERFNCLEHIKKQHAPEFTLLLTKGAIVSEAEANQTQLIEDEERRVGEEANSFAMLPKLPAYTNRKVICAFCVRRFWSTEDLRRHMRTHSGERPFQCEICLRKFTLKHSMLRHMKKHTALGQNGAAGGDTSVTGNSGSDFSDDEQMPTPTATHITPSAATTANVAVPTSTSSSALANLRTPKIQELLSKANEWRSSHLGGEQKENISEEQPNGGLHSDLIGNLLGISDQGILNKLLSSADEAAKLLGVEK